MRSIDALGRRNDIRPCLLEASPLTCSSPCTRTLTTALREFPNLEPWIALGKHRRAMPDHRTPTVLAPDHF